MFLWVCVCVLILSLNCAVLLDNLKRQNAAVVSMNFLVMFAKLNTESDTPPLAPGKTECQAKKWLHQEEGSYKPVFYEKLGPSFVSSITHLSTT
jgi:hypothetical protein